MTESIDDRRVHPRVTCDLRATIVVDGDDPVEIRCVDVSRGGICLRGDLPVPIGTSVALAVRAAWAGGQTEPLPLVGRVMWCSKVVGGDHQLGVMFSGAQAKRAAPGLAVLVDLLAGRIDVPGGAPGGASPADNEGGEPA